MSPEILSLVLYATIDTLWMVAIAAGIATLLGLPLGVFLAIYYALEYVARADRKDDPNIRKFVEIAHSSEVREFIQTRLKGVIVPAW